MSNPKSQSKELVIVFLYDTEIVLGEEDDPHNAVIYFSPTWVGVNQRMALSGQLIGVTQFMRSNFSIPEIIALKNGKFAIKKMGRYILCVGTDWNIPDWMVKRRSGFLFSALKFFHNGFQKIENECSGVQRSEKIGNIIEAYLPSLVHSGNIFRNTLAIRLPKSASNIFLDAAQVLECLQDREGIYGGVILFQNKVVISQLSTDVTKQLVLTDPIRNKIPVEHWDVSCSLPSRTWILKVFIPECQLDSLLADRLSSSTRKLSRDKESEYSEFQSLHSSTLTGSETNSQKTSTLSPKIPDLVQDTIRLVRPFPKVNVASFVVNKIPKNVSASDPALPTSNLPETSYRSFAEDKVDDDLGIDYHSINVHRQYFCNTIADPSHLWFRSNGLPASKIQYDALFADYLTEMKTSYPPKNDGVSAESCLKSNEITNATPQRPTSILLNASDKMNAQKRERTIRALNALLYDDHSNKTQDSKSVPKLKAETSVEMTPLMAKLTVLEQEQWKDQPLQPSVSMYNLNSNPAYCKSDSCDTHSTESRVLSKKSRKKKPYSEKPLRELALFVVAHRNITFYLLLNPDYRNNNRLINFLSNTCSKSGDNLETSFQECLEMMAHSNGGETYSFLNVHSEWELLQKGGVWTDAQIKLAASLHSDFNRFEDFTDLTVRTSEEVIYGNHVADSQIFYQQPANNFVGLPVPSDPIGMVALKAKRRLERDHGMLIL